MSFWEWIFFFTFFLVIVLFVIFWSKDVNVVSVLFFFWFFNLIYCSHYAVCNWELRTFNLRTTDKSKKTLHKGGSSKQLFWQVSPKRQFIEYTKCIFCSRGKQWYEYVSKVLYSAILADTFWQKSWLFAKLSYVYTQHIICWVRCLLFCWNEL